MDELFVLHTGQAFRRAGSSGLFLQRSQTNASMVSALSRQDSVDMGCCSDCSGEQGPGHGGLGHSTSGRIALAKRVLAEATHTFQPALSVSAAKVDKCRNTGALGPLMAMLESGQDASSLPGCLDTLGFMLLDKANRVQVSELGGQATLLGLLHTHADISVQRLALDCLAALVCASDRDKELVWQHPARATLLGLMNPRLPPNILVATLASLRKLAFRGHSCSPELIEPAFIHRLADILAVPQPPNVLNKCCKLLRACATDATGRSELDAWQRVLPLLISLLRNPQLLDACLGVLGALTDMYAFKNMFAAAGGVPQLLPLLLHPSRPVRLSAACILSALSEGGLSRELLCCQACIATLLHVLAAPGLCVEVAATVVFVCLAAARHSPAAAQHLADLGAPARMTQLLAVYDDDELRQAVAQVLLMLDSEQVTSSVSEDSASADLVASSAAFSFQGRALGGGGSMAPIHEGCPMVAGLLGPLTLHIADLHRLHDPATFILAPPTPTTDSAPTARDDLHAATRQQAPFSNTEEHAAEAPFTAARPPSSPRDPAQEYPAGGAWRRGDYPLVFEGERSEESEGHDGEEAGPTRWPSPTPSSGTAARHAPELCSMSSASLNSSAAGDRSSLLLTTGSSTQTMVSSNCDASASASGACMAPAPAHPPVFLTWRLHSHATAFGVSEPPRPHMDRTDAALPREGVSERSDSPVFALHPSVTSLVELPHPVTLITPTSGACSQGGRGVESPGSSQLCLSAPLFMQAVASGRSGWRNRFSAYPSRAPYATAPCNLVGRSGGISGKRSVQHPPVSSRAYGMKAYASSPCLLMLAQEPPSQAMMQGMMIQGC